MEQALQAIAPVELSANVVIPFIPVVAVLIGALLLFGVAPGLLTDQIRPAAAAIVQRVAPPAKAPATAPAAAAAHKVAVLKTH